MIQKLNPILEEATRKNRGVGAFTATTFEILRAIIDVAEKRGEPVIIKHSATYEDEVPLKYMGPVIIELSKKAKVDICPMLDHCKDTDYIKQGLKMGFTAVMYDGAELPFEENVKMGKEVVKAVNEAEDMTLVAQIDIYDGQFVTIKDAKDSVKIDTSAVRDTTIKQDSIATTQDSAKIDTSVVQDSAGTAPVSSTPAPQDAPKKSADPANVKSKGD